MIFSTIIALGVATAEPPQPIMLPGDFPSVQPFAVHAASSPSLPEPRPEPVFEALDAPASDAPASDAPTSDASASDAPVEDDLRDARGGAGVVLANQTMTAITTGNVINGAYTAGAITISDNALSSFNGLGNLLFNTGGQVSVQAGMNVTINLGR